MTRAADFDLAAALAQKNFTPSARDAAALVELVAGGDEPAATRAAPAVIGLGAAGWAAVIAAVTERPGWAARDDGARVRLVAALGLAARAGAAQARALEIELLAGSPSVRVRRAAAVALGKLGAARGDGDADGALADVRAALVARWDALAADPDAAADERRAVAEALGKVGGDAARARLAALDAGDDRELARRRDRAVLMADRGARRGEDSAIAIDEPPPGGRALTVRLRCRSGLAKLLVDELAQLGHRATRISDDSAQLTLAAPWRELYRSRLWVSAGIRVPLVAPPTADSIDPTAPPFGGAARSAQVGAIVAALTSRETRALLAAWTRGPIRWRLQVAHGHQRALVWRVARDVGAAAPELLNDPTATTWDVRVDPAGDALELVPRRAPDPRFAWRVADVAASSHPTVAAAIAFLAGARADDRVWDPFCGAGGELVERAQLAGPAAGALIGSDVDADALVAARANLAAAAPGARVELYRADARDASHAEPREVDAILTNPPLGSRVQLDAAALLEAALPNLARRLAGHGRLVWITPAHRRTTAIAERCGLRRTYFAVVDLGGVRGALERWER